MFCFRSRGLIRIIFRARRRNLLVIVLREVERRGVKGDVRFGYIGDLL